MITECIGIYVVIRKDGPNDNKNYNLNQVRLYQTPNLVQELEGQVTISAPAPISPKWVPTNLITHLDSRTSGNNKRPLINSASNRASYESCYKSSNVQLFPLGDKLEITLNMGRPFIIHCFLMV